MGYIQGSRVKWCSPGGRFLSELSSPGDQSTSKERLEKKGAVIANQIGSSFCVEWPSSSPLCGRCVFLHFSCIQSMFVMKAISYQEWRNQEAATEKMGAEYRLFSSALECQLTKVSAQPEPAAFRTHCQSEETINSSNSCSREMNKGLILTQRFTE